MLPDAGIVPAVPGPEGVPAPSGVPVQAGPSSTARGAERPAAGTELRSRAEAEAYVASVCFKHGPPRYVGVELEWLLRPARPADPADLADLLGALGPHAPAPLVPGSPAAPLPHGSVVTVEPGGQVELASPPTAGLAALVATVEADSAALHDRLAARGLTPEPRAADPVRPARRLLQLPRYRAMERAFDRFGPHGRSGMCSTSAVQVALDAGEHADLPARWAMLHDLGPVLVAAFANSPLLHGRRTGWKSSRLAAWLALDPARTAPPSSVEGDPAAAWAERVVGTPLLCVRGAGEWSTPEGVTFADWVEGRLPGRRPTVADLEYHISTLFPPVRPRGFLEVRYVDGQQRADWALPVAVLAALTARRAVVDRVREICAPARLRWTSAARHGLEDRVLAAAAVEVFTLACAELPALDPPPGLLDRLVEVTERRVAAGRCPADDPLPGEPPSGGPLETLEIIPSPTEGALP
ncbi:ergothioneine biosynthesis glutamate--cysteine ligase EgtA [Pseudonocardia sp. RS11V-5]|uniref:ergothioneine biosynthesis glutamate--cysteine ligase EgtA n=1 Tax=Pseudonocardia terrae TaxID=2905831 RepID=UPI001E5245C4|nr:ergothioneine biosynthesis glutamate--cysteine ligase EgtA [Pseudonocardia terrae]MCE3550028.1 ergothioneine biosynthesis glutamate--cysteine ligase EgtA [Pseudonocardia terrae]